MLSWKVWTTFVIVCISCVEYWHSNSCVSLINCCTTWSCSCWLKQVMVTWVQPRHEGSLSILCIFVHISYMLRVTLFTFGKYLPIQFSNMIKIRFFAFVKCLPLRFSCFSIFSNLFLVELCLLISELIVSSPSCHVSFRWAFLVCSLADIFAIVSLLFVVLHWSIVNRAGSLLWITLLTTKQSNYDL